MRRKGAGKPEMREKGRKVVLAVKVESKIARRLRMLCRDKGLKQGYVVEKALREELEREELAEDLKDLKSLREYEERAVPLEEYLKSRGV